MFEEERISMEHFDSNGKGKINKRSHQRYNTPATVICKFFNRNLKGKSSFQGFIQDISLGGVSLEIRDDFLIIKDSVLKYTRIEMALELNLPDGIYKMNFSGIISWCKRVKKKNMSFLYLGIQFYHLDESSKETLKKYLALGTGDKNLIWNLWDNLSIKA